MAHLLILGGAGGDQRVALEKGEILIGRAPEADVRIEDRKASSTHCRIAHEADGYRIRDLESQNGTWINGERVVDQMLAPGDVISVGATEIRFEEKSAFLSTGQFGGPPPGDAPPHPPASTEVTRLRRLVSWSRRLTHERDHPKLLALMIDSVVELSGADRGFLWLVDEAGSGRIRVAKRFELEALKKPTFKVARGIAAAVSRDGKAIVSTSAEEDPRIKEFGNTGALYLRSVACVPIRAGRRLLGAVYLDNRFERGVFRPEDLPFLLAFADQAAIALENARLHAEADAARREVEELNRALQGRVEAQQAELGEVRTLYARIASEERTKYTYDRIVGKSPAMRELFFMLDRVTDSDVPVYLRGESGSGKELCARAIHFNGARAKGPFVTENCAAIPESLFESELFGYVKGAFTGASADKRGLFSLADRGTLFLDEIADLPLAVQAKLLRALQEGAVRPVGGRGESRVDVRILTASNRDLAAQVRKGAFREDLYHRIHVIEVEVPPLRRRLEDLPLLVDHFLANHAAERGEEAPRGISPAALDLLQRHDWPGNVRELQNEILRALTLSDGVVEPECLSDGVRGAAGSISGRFRAPTLREAVRQASREVERELITEALRLESGNKSAAARRLGITRPTLDAKMEGLKIPRYPA